MPQVRIIRDCEKVGKKNFVVWSFSLAVGLVQTFSLYIVSDRAGGWGRSSWVFIIIDWRASCCCCWKSPGWGPPWPAHQHTQSRSRHQPATGMSITCARRSALFLPSVGRDFHNQAPAADLQASLFHSLPIYDQSCRLFGSHLGLVCTLDGHMTSFQRLLILFNR